MESVPDLAPAPVLFPPSAPPPDLAQLHQHLSATLATHHLLGLTVGPWLMILRPVRSEPPEKPEDPEEPFWASTFLIHSTSRVFLHRIYGRTLEKGSFEAWPELPPLIHRAFSELRACRGFSAALAPSGKIFEADFTLQNFPFDRIVSKDCLVAFQPESAHLAPAEDAFMCERCRELFWRIKAQPEMVGNLKPVPVKDEATPSDDESLMRLRKRRPKRKRRKDEDFWEPDSDLNGEKEADDSSIKSEFQTLPLDVTMNHDEEDELEAKVKRKKRAGRKKKAAVADSFNESDSEYDPDDDKEEVQREIEALHFDEMHKHRQKNDPGRAPFECDHCGKDFKLRGQLRAHWVSINRLGDFVCKLCTFQCTFLSGLLAHVELVHPENIREFAHLRQEDEEMEAMKDPKKCGVCNMIFNGNTMLFRHRAQYHELGDFKCADCGVPSLTRYDLMVHRSRVHDETIVKEIPSLEGMQATIGPDGKVKLKRQSFICDACGKGFKYDSGCDAHRRTKHCWGMFNCDKCDQMCHYASSFVAHLAHFHPEDEMIDCPSCSERIAFTPDPHLFYGHYMACTKRLGNAQIRGHKMSHDSGKKRNTLTFQCDECGRSFSSKYQFQAHVDSHRGIEKYKCEDCDYATNFPHVYTDHRKIHLREKGLTNADTDVVLFHPCHVCGKQFRTMSSLREHVKVVHEGIRKEMPCGDCGMVFYSKGAFYNHKKKIHGFVSNRTRCGKRNFLTGTTIKPDANESKESPSHMS
ncbi:hypothetical protein TCAL_05202 [Tigriopus californicus]|uniref:C2H2-type domain-containing protein n=1 Tax=Tigriopus californicus TaxID=6832 RepID=A0A553NXM6_TIGCA|nr:zinc finger protein 93-like [Tigriopus californicus]TRY70167.1 hypothetical protein TCAL_05202 [Tigriopus californicus]|eukprot:TCALIF_05202-PA protein Name:"Similar to ZNF273 Zinc finger protein 273 (Homo sapiens)" AED:0.14 eAED:0.17 QI:0/-1/0/1/-1/1/1/0/749